MKVSTKNYGGLNIYRLSDYDCNTKQQQERAEEMGAVAYIDWPADVESLPGYIYDQISAIYKGYAVKKIGSTRFKKSVFAILGVERDISVKVDELMENGSINFDLAQFIVSSFNDETNTIYSKRFNRTCALEEYIELIKNIEAKSKA